MSKKYSTEYFENGIVFTVGKYVKIKVHIFADFRYDSICTKIISITTPTDESRTSKSVINEMADEVMYTYGESSMRDSIETILQRTSPYKQFASRFKKFLKSLAQT